MLGDSYSAGNGAGAYYGTRGCRQSHKNYGEDFASLLAKPPFDQPAVVVTAACSGATTDWILNPHGSLPAQQYVAAHGKNSPYDLIFLTTGGDNVHFADIVKFCLIAAFQSGPHCLRNLDRAIGQLNDGSVARGVRRALGAIGAASPRATIVLVGYPYLERDPVYEIVDRGEGRRSVAREPCGRRRINTNFVTVGACLKLLGRLGDKLQQHVVHQLNGLAGAPWFVLVNTKKLFEGPPNHELRAPITRRSGPQRSRWFVQPWWDTGLISSDTWYHPNPTGWLEEAKLLLRDSLVPKHPIG
ncbi:MAG: GDSL-type esterase/lipase family protein [Solirubrobacteraceae bacterium]